MRFEDVVERMVNEKKNPIVLNSWVDADLEAFKCVKNLFTQTMFHHFEYMKFGNFKFKVDYTPGGGAGMVEFPAVIKLYCLVDFEKRRIEL